MSHDATDRSAYISLGVLLGLAGGAIAGLLYAPQSGRESREQLKSRAQEAKYRAQDEIEAKKNMAMDKVSETAEKTHRAASRVRNTPASDLPAM